MNPFFRPTHRNYLMLSFLLFLCSACATSFVVNSEANDGDTNLADGLCETTNGDCTLRAAIQQANANPNADVITFAENVSVIQTSNLPHLTSSNIAIKGGGKVTLDGGQGGCGVQGFHTALYINNSSYNVISGLTIINYSTGIRVEGSSADARYNIIGINPNVNDPPEAQRNVIGGACSGVWIYGANAYNNTVAGNYIGTDISGSSPNPNMNGIVVSSGAHDNLIGATTAIAEMALDTTDMISYWPLDESSGPALDAHGNNDLADNNTVGSASGLVNGARDLERSNEEFFSIADNASLSTGDIDYSISAWIKLESLPSTSGNMPIVSKDNGGTSREFLLRVNATNLVRFNVYDGADLEGGVSASSFGPLSTGVWYHIVAYHSATNNEVGISVNGVADSAATSGAPADTAAAFRIGRQASNYFDGLIDEVGFWKRALSPAEMSGLYGSGAGVGYSQPSLAGNLVSGNSSAGIMFSHDATNNHLTGNLIGTNASGSAALGNGVGIQLDNAAGGNIIGIGPAGNGSGNLISGNLGTGISIQTNNNVVAGNLIGTTASGQTALGNQGRGISIYFGTGNRIGTNGDGVADGLERNIISANGLESFEAGVALAGNNNVVAGNYIGTDISGTEALGNYDGVTIGGSGNRVGTDGNGAGDLLEANLISGNLDTGVNIQASSNKIAGNLIGTDGSGMAALGNGYTGLYIASYGQNNIIGTDGNGQGDTAEKNVISGNGFAAANTAGLDISGSSNVVAGNFIGTNMDGSAALGNAYYGMIISGNGNRIGTNGNGVSDVAERNVISGSGNSALMISGSNNWLAGNYIGTDAAGTAAIPNGWSSDFSAAAIRLHAQASSNIIGTNGNGTGDAAERNVISGNTHSAISISQQGTSNNVVAGNYIGVDASGGAVLANIGLGVEIHLGAGNNRIGTDGNGVGDAAEANVIGGNAVDGVMIIVSSSNQVAGNFIGTNQNGAALGNGRYGVNIDGSNTGVTTANVVGGSLQKANVIAFNNWSGVKVSSVHATSNPILYNSIHSNGANGEVGINLQPGDQLYGLTPNDAGDGDIGGNDLMNFPELSVALAVNNSVTITGEMVDGLPNATFKIQFFSVPQCDQYTGHGEGKTYLGETSQTTNGSGDVGFLVNLAVAVTPGEFISSTATNNNNTSEFSACVEITAGQTLQGESPDSEPGLIIIPNRNINCRTYCTAASDIADTLFEGVQYKPLSWDPLSGFFAFDGPFAGQRCYAPPVSGGTPFMSLYAFGGEISLDQVSSDLVPTFTCPFFPTATPTINPDEGVSASATPTRAPECSDGIDNDGDGRIDYDPTGGGDRECTSPEDDES